MDSFQTKSTLTIGKKTYHYYSLPALEKHGMKISRLPFSLKIVLENLLRFEDGISVKADDISYLGNWNAKGPSEKEIEFMPARVLMQDFTGVPAIVDLASMRDAIVEMGGDPAKINPLCSTELVIDHSVQVDYYGTADAEKKNTALEFKRNEERYLFLKWGQKAFDKFKVVPPSTGIVHQVNLEYLARVVMTLEKNNESILCPDTLVGTDSHTTMVNGLGVLGWGVGGIEAEACLLGQPTTMLVPQVIGMRLRGELSPTVTSTDLVLTITEILRKKGVVGKFVEFFGEGLRCLTLEDRATIANMAPEYGATCGLFPIDDKTLTYLRMTGRPAELVDTIEQYLKAQGMFLDPYAPEAEYTDTLELDLSTVEPSLSGPKRPQDRVALSKVSESFEKLFPDPTKIEAKDNELSHGSVVLASITSCTNTSNPAALFAAGLLAKKACERGLKSKPWVKTSLAPGSRVSLDYLQKAGLSNSLNQLGFNIVGFGCTTCIGNSGPLNADIQQAIDQKKLLVASVLSGNRNFEGRVHSKIKANYLASPPLVVAYALAGTVKIDLSKDPLGKDSKGQDVFLKDIWPSSAEVNELIKKYINSGLFAKNYSDVFAGDASWKNLNSAMSLTYPWEENSTYIRKPPFFQNISKEIPSVKDVTGARVLALLGDSITTDHISPAGNIAAQSPAGLYLQSKGVKPEDFNQYGARRGNYEIMVRGTFANVRLKNLLLKNVEGGETMHFPTQKQMSIFDAAMTYRLENTPLIVIAGKEYGSGSSRDWAAKGPYLLGIKVVIAESYERIHRSNLIGMGILPLEFFAGQNAQSLGLTGEEVFSFTHIDEVLTGGQKRLKVTYRGKDGEERSFLTHVRIDTPQELHYYRNGGILPYVLRKIA